MKRIKRLPEETIAEVTNVRSERESAAARYHKVSVSVRRIADAREKRRDKAPDIDAWLRMVNEEGYKVRDEAHMAEWCEFRERVASFTSHLESQILELQSLPV